MSYEFEHCGPLYWCVLWATIQLTKGTYTSVEGGMHACKCVSEMVLLLCKKILNVFRRFYTDGTAVPLRSIHSWACQESVRQAPPLHSESRTGKIVLIFLICLKHCIILYTWYNCKFMCICTLFAERDTSIWSPWNWKCTAIYYMVSRRRRWWGYRPAILRLSGRGDDARNKQPNVCCIWLCGGSLHFQPRLPWENRGFLEVYPGEDPWNPVEVLQETSFNY